MDSVGIDGGDCSLMVHLAHVSVMNASETKRCSPSYHMGTSPRLQHPEGYEDATAEGRHNANRRYRDISLSRERARMDLTRTRRDLDERCPSVSRRD